MHKDLKFRALKAAFENAWFSTYSLDRVAQFLVGCSIAHSNILIPRCCLLSSRAVDGAVEPLPSPVQRVGIQHHPLHVSMASVSDRAAVSFNNN
jgi:hypothetical protein